MDQLPLFLGQSKRYPPQGSSSKAVKFSIRTLLILIALVALLIPILFRYFSLATQPDLSVTSTAKYTNYDYPYVNCISVHDDPWGRVRIIVLHRVTSESYALNNAYPDWVDPNFAALPLRINGKEVFCRRWRIGILCRGWRHARAVTNRTFGGSAR